MKRRGLGWVFQRGSTWWIQYFFRGKRYRESSGSTVRMDAIKLLRRRMAEMGQGSSVDRISTGQPLSIWRKSSRMSIESMDAARCLAC